MQSLDVSLQDFMKNNYNPFGETLSQNNLNVASAFSVGTYWQAANSTSGIRSSERIESQVFRIDNMGNLAWNANDLTGTAGTWTFATTTGTGISATLGSLTTGTGISETANALTTGTALDISSTSTAGGASGTSKLLNLSRSGANASASHTAYGLYSSVTNTGDTSTNVAAYLSATGATNNYALIIANGNMGIGTSTPSSSYSLAVNGSLAASAFYDYDNSTYFLDPAATATSLNIAGGASIGGYATASASLSVGTYNAPAGPGNAVFSGLVGIGASSPGGRLNIAGNTSASAWGLSGIQFRGDAATYTDTSTAGSGTATNAVFTSLAQPTLAAANTSVTTTNAATFYIANAPTAGTNQTITNPYALWVDAGNVRFDGTTIYQGTSTYIHNTGGTSNFFAGVTAGNTTLTGTFNTAVGNNAGNAITSGSTNTLIGRYAGAAITTGGGNNLFGYNSGINLTEGGNNAFFGDSAGQSNTTGSRNTFLGSGVAASGTITGTDNTAVGQTAASLLSTGNYNTYLGAGGVGRTATTASNRTMVGYAAGYYSTGADNTFIGYTAGQTTSTGTNNTFLGSVAGNANTTGSNNILIGYAAGDAITTGANNIVIGYDVDAPS
ncbi:MAG: hypothetical protein HYT40_00690, partial [Candidatus Sungbacteria bacterium]|nr:hypothetical protein [Candidatus Sungbacteria bacterium]